jgi:hypothetical protein
LVTGFDGEDGGSGGKDLGVRDEVGGTHVGSNTDVLNDTGYGSHGGDISEGTVKVEVASRGDRRAEGGKSFGQEGKMGGLISGDGRELLRDDGNACETCILEV